MTRAPLTIMAVLAALLLGRVVADRRLGGGARAGGTRGAGLRDRQARRGAARAALRHAARARWTVTPEQARREGLEDLDRSYPEARRRADEQVLKLLGLIDPAVDLRDVSASVFSEGVAGYYDPRTKRMRTVRGAATGTRVLAEMVLAHELTHALEDQRFGLDLEGEGGSDDAALARLALVEGTASELMYALRAAPLHAGGDARRRARQRVRATTGSLPGFLQAQLVFPYTGGAGVRRRAARAGRRALDARGPRRAHAAARVDGAGHAPGEVGAGRAAAAGADRRRGGAGRRLEPGRVRRARRVPDARAAGPGGRRRLGRRRGGLGRGPLRAVARAGAATARRLPERRRAGDALALGHAADLREFASASCASGCATGSAPSRGRRGGRGRRGAAR